MVIKSRYVFLVSLFIATTSFSQEIGVRVDSSAYSELDSLDSIYTPLADLVPWDSVSVVWERDFWRSLHQEFVDKGIDLKMIKKLWIAVYCSPTGEIKRLFYSSPELRNGSFERKLQQAINAFAVSYCFPIRAKKQFTQCGTFVLSGEKPPEW
jgi:hypothetical protein